VLSQTAPLRDNSALYDEVAAARVSLETTELGRLAPQVKSAYRSYGTSLSTTTVPMPILADEKGEDASLLRGNWDVLGRVAFQSVRTEVLQASLGICCLCGYNSAGQVDHYLPKKWFPEFSIFTDNLIAACGRCNNRKRTRYKRTGRASPAFVHPYIHRLPAERFLVCRIEVDEAVIVSFDVEQSESMDSDIFSLLKYHFDLLDLAEFYRRDAVGLMDEQRNDYYASYRYDGAREVRKTLLRQARSAQAWHASNRRMNHWKPVLLGALAESDDFCDGGFVRLGPELPVA